MQQVISFNEVLERRTLRQRTADPNPAVTTPPGVWDRIKDHPCYSDDAHHYFARIHLPVAPACNVQCNYCNRKFDCANESRPGVTSNRLSPAEGLARVRSVAAQMPNLSVVGIAGPGDALCEARRTFETLSLVRDALPDLKLCLSTNGLALPDHIDRIKDLGVDHVTITINALDPAIAARIYAWVGWKGRRLTGRTGAAVLLERQMEGLAALTAAGVLVKVNSVMIPGVNDQHLIEVNAAVRSRGAFLHNIVPLISDPAHGTVYGLEGQRGPTAAELRAVQESLGQDARLMKHCRQCRADAVGLLGSECGTGTAVDGAPAPACAGSAPGQPDPVPPDLAAAAQARALYRQVVADDRAERAGAAAAANRAVRAVNGGVSVLVAVCTKGGGRVNQHFGHAREFQVYQAGPDGVSFAGVRRADNYCKVGGSDDRMEAILTALDGVAVVLCARIGDRPRQQLEKAGIAVSDRQTGEYVEVAVAAAVAERFPVSADATA